MGQVFMRKSGRQERMESTLLYGFRRVQKVFAHKIDPTAVAKLLVCVDGILPQEKDSNIGANNAIENGVGIHVVEVSTKFAPWQLLLSQCLRKLWFLVVMRSNEDAPEWFGVGWLYGCCACKKAMPFVKWSGVRLCTGIEESLELGGMVGSAERLPANKSTFRNDAKHGACAKTGRGRSFAPMQIRARDTATSTFSVALKVVSWAADGNPRCKYSIFKLDTPTTGASQRCQQSVSLSHTKCVVVVFCDFVTAP